MPITRPCDTCGEPVTRTPSKMKHDSVYCSRGCQHEGYRDRVTKPCATCGDAVTRVRSHMEGDVYCSPSCAYEARRKRPDELSSRRMLVDPDHPLAPPGGKLVAEHRAVLYDDIGSGPHPCYWCGDEIDWKPGAGPVSGALVVDHVNNDPSDNSRENLVPSCQPCNGTRHSPVALEEGEHYIVRGDRRLRTQEQVCPTCEETFRAIPSDNQTYCSRECLYRRNQ